MTVLLRSRGRSLAAALGRSYAAACGHATSKDVRSVSTPRWDLAFFPHHNVDAAVFVVDSDGRFLFVPALTKKVKVGATAPVSLPLHLTSVVTQPERLDELACLRSAGVSVSSTSLCGQKQNAERKELTLCVEHPDRRVVWVVLSLGAWTRVALQSVRLDRVVACACEVELREFWFGSVRFGSLHEIVECKL